MTMPELLTDAVAGPEGRARWLRDGSAGAERDALMQGRSAEAVGALGAVASGSPHATRVGMGILRQGGTAAEHRPRPEPTPLPRLWR